LVWPVLWLLYTLAVGRITGWYPYFFLDLGQTRPGEVALYCVAILILLFVVSCLFWMGDRWLPRPSFLAAHQRAGVGGPELH
jgi:CHASE2 domain-containing sensor protein